MDNLTSLSTYVIHSDEEPLRLERQARLYGTADDLDFANLGPGQQLLDAGCGSGTAARMFAKSVPSAIVTGVDRNATYLDFAQRQARSEAVANASFQLGDVLSLPFKDDVFDVVWSKHLLQWVARREDALNEFVRVTRPGGRVIACNFDGFCMSHTPTDPIVQRGVEQWFAAASKDFGFDTDIGRKLPVLFRQAGLTDIRFRVIPDKAFCGFGGDPERRWNWETQWQSAMQFSTKVFGSEDAARDISRNIVDRFNDRNVFVYVALFYVEGTVRTQI